jgi:hypothetical protein
MYNEIWIADFQMPPFKASNGTRRLREHSLDRFPVCGWSSDRMLKQCRPQGLPDRNAGNASAGAQLAHPGRGHRPCHSAPLTPGPPGAQSPGQRPPRPRRALPARRVGRWPALLLHVPVYGALSRTGGETRCVSGSRPHRRKPFLHRSNGRGHRPCHSATLTSRPPGAQSPRPAPAPPPAGASRPPGRALASRCAWTCRSTGNRLARAGKRGAFRGPARTDESTFTASMAGAIAPATAPR